jgi:hypothetical protein
MRDGWEGYVWCIPLRAYYSSEKDLLFCPMATKLREEGFRDPWAAWGPMDLAGAGSADLRGSYGMNNWCTSPAAEVEFIHGREATEDNFRNMHSVKGAHRIPLFVDCAFIEGKPYDFDTPPEYDGDISTYAVSALQMKRFCMNRHDGFVNGLFLDLSIRRIGLKELWTFKWHRRFDTANVWTKAGGVQAEDWPRWMRGFKDP